MNRFHLFQVRCVALLYKMYVRSTFCRITKPRIVLNNTNLLYELFESEEKLYSVSQRHGANVIERVEKFCITLLCMTSF